MSKKCEIVRDHYYDEIRKLVKVEKNFLINDRSNWPTGNPKRWEIKYSNTTSLFLKWFVSNYKTTIVRASGKKGISDYEGGIDFDKFKNMDGEEVIKRLE